MAAAVGTSRLDLMIARLSTQRACLARAADLIGALDGWIIEVGLGKGRTYDHLRALLPDREIFAFDRDVHAPKDCVPDAKHLILGEFRDTLPAFAERHRRAAALVHADIGSENRDADGKLVQALAGPLVQLLRPGGMVALASPCLAGTCPRVARARHTVDDSESSGPELLGSPSNKTCRRRSRNWRTGHLLTKTRGRRGEIGKREIC